MFDWLRQPKLDPRLPAPEDEYDRAVLGDVARVGWSVIQINPDDPENEPPYSFSVGLFHTHKHPEIILMGLPHPIAGAIINSIADMVKMGARLDVDRVYDDFTNAGNVFKTVDPRYYEQYVGYALWLYRSHNFPMLQCVWPLKSGLYPWDEGYPPEGAEIQPYLGR